MKSYFYAPIRLLAVAVLMLSLLVGAACDRGASSLAFDKAEARKSLQEFLDCWKGGKPIAEFRSAHPKVVANDFEWEHGLTLTSYSLGAESDDGTNLHATVELVVRGAEGGESSQQVVYIVGTRPQVTIFRE
jgi:hypothetical protein